MITSVKGMRDLLPPETRVWNRLEETTRTVFSLYGYDEIRTPSLEPTELFVRSVGEASDIVHKEMYSFTDRGGREVTLRPENTAGVARAFIEHGMAAGGRREEALLRRPAVPLRAAAEGALPRVPADRRRGARRGGPGDGRRAPRHALRPPRPPRLHGALRLAQQRGERGLPAGLRGGAPRVPPRARGEDGRGRPAAASREPAAGPRHEGPFAGGGPRRGTPASWTTSTPPRSRTTRSSSRSSTPNGSRIASSPGSCADSTTTRAPSSR